MKKIIADLIYGIVIGAIYRMCGFEIAVLVCLVNMAWDSHKEL